MASAETRARTVVDSRGSGCPGPITDLAKAYRRSHAGELIELWATDPGVKPDVRAWASRTGNRIVSIEDRDDHIEVVVEIVKR